eukprot:gb/GEZN01010123.1/.p1 GENE.gb/GEZN01010123.1/~~gb/GEZN01010123.1/.p1  ORF type:complete len:273 (+),score=53.60 gb/GEZN01010123.1/:61-879(+)
MHPWQSNQSLSPSSPSSPSCSSSFATFSSSLFSSFTWCSSLLRQLFLQSARLDPSARQLCSKSLFGLALAVTLLALASCRGLCAIINHNAISSGRYTGTQSVSDLLILDLRHGYTSQEVIVLFLAWGRGGRLLYLAIEAIDVCFYQAGYRAATLVLCNALVNSLQAQGWSGRTDGVSKILHFFPFLPIFLARLDALEDLLQVGLVVLFELLGSVSVDSSGVWDFLLNLSSSVNKTKWLCVHLGLYSLFGLLCLLGLSLSGLISPTKAKHFKS